MYYLHTLFGLAYEWVEERLGKVAAWFVGLAAFAILAVAVAWLFAL
jgi:hypothetical protein